MTTIRPLLPLLLAMGLAGPALAQDQPAAGSMMMRAAHMPTDPAQQAAHLAKQLNLSQDQVAKIQPILQDRQQQLDALRSDSSLSPDDRHSRMRDIMKTHQSQLEAVLTDSQKQQYEQLRQQMMQRRAGGN